jgi:hypothetical protein
MGEESTAHQGLGFPRFAYLPLGDAMLTRDSRLALGIFFVLCVLLLSTMAIFHTRLQTVSMEIEWLQRTLAQMETAVGDLKTTIEQSGRDGIRFAASQQATEIEPCSANPTDLPDAANAQLREEIEKLQSELRELRLRQGQLDVRLSEATTDARANAAGAVTDPSPVGAGPRSLKLPSVALDKLAPGERETFKSAVLDVLREKQLEDTYRSYMQSAEQMVKHYTTWLSLSSQQQAEVSSVVYRQYQELYEIQYGSKQPADRSTLGTVLNEAQTRHFDEIGTHLDTGQKAKFDEWRQARSNSLEAGSLRKSSSRTTGNGQ